MLVLLRPDRLASKFFASSWKSQWTTALTLKMATSKSSFHKNPCSKKTHADLDSRELQLHALSILFHDLPERTIPSKWSPGPSSLYVHTGLLRHTTMSHLQPKSSQGTSRRAGQLSNIKFIIWCHIDCAQGILNALKQCISSLWAPQCGPCICFRPCYLNQKLLSHPSRWWVGIIQWLFFPRYINPHHLRTWHNVLLALHSGRVFVRNNNGWRNWRLLAHLHDLREAET